MSSKKFVQNYIAQMLVEYGRIVEMDGRTWHF